MTHLHNILRPTDWIVHCQIPELSISFGPAPEWFDCHQLLECIIIPSNIVPLERGCRSVDSINVLPNLSGTWWVTFTVYCCIDPECLVPFLGGLSLHLNHLIASRTANYDWPFGTLPFGLFGSNLDTRDLETYPRTYSGHFWNMLIFDDSRAIWVLFRKWVVSENQSFLDEGAIITPLSV